MLFISWSSVGVGPRACLQFSTQFSCFIAFTSPWDHIKMYTALDVFVLRFVQDRNQNIFAQLMSSVVFYNVTKCT